MQFFYLKDADNHYLSVVTSGKNRGSICVSSKANSQNVSRLYAFVLKHFPGLIFLCAEDQSISLHFSGRPFFASPLLVGIEGGVLPHTVSLYDFLDHTWLCFPPLSDPNSLEEQVNISTLSRNKLGWEAVTIVDVPVEDVPSYIHSLAACYAKLFTNKPDVNAIRKIIFSSYPNEIKQNVINSFYPLLGVNELDEIVVELKNSPEFTQQFLNVFSTDFWCKDALYPLLAWEQNRINKSVITCDEKYDHLDKYFKEREFSSIAHAINCIYRRSIAPTKKACVVTTVRNEGISILEWIAWYKSLGFEHFFIFSNDNNDGSDDLLQALASAGVITWIKNKMGANIRPQAKVCKYAFSVLPEVLEYEWCLVLDIDEFLSINKDLFQNITGLLSWVEKNKVDALGFNWQYTSSGEVFDPTQFVTQRVKFFIKDDVIGLANNLIKSMSKPRYMISAADHCAVWSHKYSVIYRLIQGDIHRYARRTFDPNVPNDDPMFADFTHRGIANVVHYHYKSASEFLLRLYRGDALNTHSARGMSLEMFDDNLVNAFNVQYKSYGEQIPENFMRGEFELRRYVDYLLSLPNVNDAYNNVLVITKKRVENIINFLNQNRHSLNDSLLKLLEYAQQNK